MSSDVDFKVLFLGPFRSGKTSILEKYLFGKAPRDHVASMGAGVFPKRVTRDGRIIEINFWDLPGQDRTPVIAKQLIRNSQAIILVFDLADPVSFSQLATWKSALDARLENVPVFVLGNKLDLLAGNQKQISNWTRDMQNFAAANSKSNPIVNQFLVSALNTDNNLSTCLETIIDYLVNQQIARAATGDDNIPLGQPRPSQNRLCCAS